MWLFHRSMNGERQNIFIAFSGNCGYSSLMLHENLTNGSFLKISCIEESEITSVNFLYQVTLKFIHLSYTLNEPLFMHGFVICIGQQENIDSPSYVDYPNVDIFHYATSKIPISQYYYPYHQKSWEELGNSYAHGGRRKVFQILMLD